MKIRRLQAWIAEQLFGRQLKVAAGAALVCAVGIADTNAQTWAPTTSANWNDTASWAGGIVPVSGNTVALTFGGTTAYTATNDIGAFTLNKIIVGNTAATTIDGGAGLTFAGTTPALTINAGSGASTILGPMTYSAATAIANNSGSLLTLSGAQAINGNLTFSGTGAYTISGASTIAAARTFTNNGTGLLTLGAVAMGANALTVTGTGNTTIGGSISGTIAAGTTTLTKSGTGTLRLSGANTFTGNIALSAGTLSIGAASTLGAAGNTITIANNTTIVSNANLTTTTAATNGHIFSVAANATTTWDTGSNSISLLGNQLIGTTGTLNKTGTGILNLGSSGTSTIGTINVNQGIFRVSSNRTGSVGAINVNPTGQFQIIDDGNPGTFNIAAGRTLTLNGNGPSLNVAGTDVNTTPGAFALLDQSPTVTTAAGPFINWTNAVNLASDSSIGVYNGTAANRFSTLSLNGAVTGPGNLIKTGNGVLILNAAGNTYGGTTNTTTVLNGGLQISGGNDRLPVATSVILGDATTNTSGVFDVNGLSQTIAGLSTAGTGTANRVISTNTTTPGTVNVNLATGSQTYAGFLGGTVTLGGTPVPGDNFNFAKSGAGNLTLTAANTYSGSTTVSAGTLTIANVGALPTSNGAVTVASGAVLDLSAVAGGYNFGASRVLTAGRSTAAANDIVGSIAVDGTFNVGGTGTAATATISGNSGFNAATFQFDLNNITASGNDLVAVGGNLVFSGLNTIAVTKLNGPLANGNYKLFSYAGTLTGDASNLAVTGATGGRQTTAIDTISTPGSVFLAVNGTAANLTWVGNAGSNIWDQGNTVRFSGAANNDNRFFDGDIVTFDGTGVGDATPVLVTGALSPTTFNVVGSQNYTFSDGGSGNITGNGNIALNGSGTVTLGVPVTTTGTTALTTGTLSVVSGGSVAGPFAMTGGTVNATTAGAFNGSVAINGGTFIALNPFGSAINNSSIAVSGSGVLQIGNGGTEGDITGTVALSAGGTLAFNRSDTPSFSTTITGSGNIANNGAGEVTLPTAIPSGNYNFTGTGNLILSGNISGATTLTQSGPGTTRLTGTNNQTGAINITGGKLQVGVLSTTGAASAVVTIDGGTYHATTGQTNAQPFNIGPNGGTIQVTPYFDFVKGTNGISGVGNTLTITGGGTVALQGSGDTSVSNVIVENGIYRHTSTRYVTAITTPYTIDVKPGSTLYNLDTTSFGGNNFFPYGNLSGTGAAGSKITLNGDGYTGDGGGGGANGATTMFGAYLHALGEASTAASNAATSNIKVPVILASTSRFTLVQGSDTPANRSSTERITDSLIGGVSGPGGLIVDGDGIGTLAISTIAATYGGPTRVAAGTLRIGLNDALPTSTTLTLGGTTGDNVPNSSGTFELNGFSQTVTGLDTVGFGSSNRIGNGTAANGSLIVNYNGSSPQTFSGSIGYTDQSSNSFRNLALTKNGTGTLILSGTNDYTLATNVNAGTLVITTAASLPSNTAPVNVASGAVLDVSAVAGGYSFIAGRTLTLGRTTAPANDLLGSAILEGNLNIGGTNTAAVATISGDLTLNSGSFNFDLSNLLATGNDQLSIGGNLAANGLTTFFINQTVGTLAQGNYTLLSYGGTLTGNATNFALSGIVTTGSRATYAIDTTTTAGAVLLNVTGAAANLTWVGNAGNNAWDLIGTANFSGSADNRFYNNDSVTFDSTGVGDATPVTINAALSPLSITVAGTKNYTFSGTGSLTSESLIKSGSATLTLNVPVTSTSTTVNEGTLSIDTGGSITGAVTVAGGTLTNAVSNSVSGPVTVTSGTVNGAADGAFTGSVSITGGTFVASNPTGTAINNSSISVANTGVLQIGNGSTAGNITGPLSFSNGGTLAYNRSDAVSFENNITWNGNFNINNQGAGVVTRAAATAVGPNTLTIGGTGETTFAGVVSGNGQIIKNDSGITNFTGDNTFNGTVTINGGTMVLADLGGGGDLDASLITINNTGKFVFGPNGNPDFPASTFITINTGGTSEFRVGEDFGGITLAGGELLLSGGDANLTNSTINSSFTSGTITSTGATRAVGGARAIIKTTPGEVMVTDTNLNATGGLSILDGTINTNAGLTNTGTLTLGDTTTKGTLQLRTAAAQAIAKPVTLNAGGGTINVSNSSGMVTWSGVISGSGTIEKAGPGTLALTGTNTYTGSTTVTGGKLVINGNSAAATGAITVSGTGSIGGGGTIGGMTTVASTATLAPGNSAGTLTFASGLTLSSGSSFQWELSDNSTSGAGSISDQVIVTGGALTVGSTVNFVPTFIGTSTLPSTGGFWSSSQVWSNVFNVTGTGTITAGSATNFVIDNSPWASFGSFTTQAAATGTGVDLVWTSNIVAGSPDLAVGSVTNGNLFVLQNASLNSAVATVTLTNGNSDTGTVSGATSSNAILTASTGQTIGGSGNVSPNSSITLTNTSSPLTLNNATVTYNATPTDTNPANNTATVNVRIGNAPLDAASSSTAFGAALTAATPISVTPYTGLASNTLGQTPTGTTVPVLGTTATIFNYTNSSGTDTGISMAWRSRTAAEASSTTSGDNGTLAAGYLISDVVNLTGMGNTGGVSGFTDTFILQMSYNEALLNGFETSGVNVGNIFIGWKNGTEWVNAVDGNSTPGGTYFANQAYDFAPRSLGDYGIDPGNNVVWAVLNHNSEFAVIPEPSTLVLGGLALLGFAGAGLRKRRMGKRLN